MFWLKHVGAYWDSCKGRHEKQTSGCWFKLKGGMKVLDQWATGWRKHLDWL